MDEDGGHYLIRSELKQTNAEHNLSIKLKEEQGANPINVFFSCGLRIDPINPIVAINLYCGEYEQNFFKQRDFFYRNSNPSRCFLLIERFYTKSG